MASSSRARCSGPVLPMEDNFYRSIKLSSSKTSTSSSSSAFSSQSPSFLHRSSSPTRVNRTDPAPSMRFSIDRPTSHVGFAQPKPLSSPPSRQRTCLCSPTAHPGSFRCSIHNNLSSSGAVLSPSNKLNARRTVNSLVRIGTVEGGNWMGKYLAALIRPSFYHQRRRAAFRPRRSRLSVMSTAEDCSS